MSDWIDVINELPKHERPVWVVVHDSKFGPVVLEARYYENIDEWTTGEDASEFMLREKVYCWQEIISPEIPQEWRDAIKNEGDK